MIDEDDFQVEVNEQSIRIVRYILTQIEGCKLSKLGELILKLKQQFRINED